MIYVILSLSMSPKIVRYRYCRHSVPFPFYSGKKGKIMPPKRIIIGNWLVDIAIDPKNEIPLYTDEISPPSNSEVENAVRTALNKLSPQEREFVERYYFQGESYRQIAKALKKRDCRIESLHRTAMRKLKNYLASFVKEKYGIEIEPDPNCAICLSSNRRKIDSLIDAKKISATWKSIIRTLRENYHINIKTPQSLIAHQKYHGEDYRNEE